MSCATCYQVKLPEDNGFIYVKSGITGVENYFWKITDHFGNVFRGECLLAYANSSSFIIDPSEIPPFVAGLFHAFSGAYTLEVVNPYDIVQMMTFSGDEYSCVSMEFYKNTGDVIQSVIQ